MRLRVRLAQGAAAGLLMLLVFALAESDSPWMFPAIFGVAAAVQLVSGRWRTRMDRRTANPGPRRVARPLAPDAVALLGAPYLLSLAALMALTAATAVVATGIPARVTAGAVAFGALLYAWHVVRRGLAVPTLAGSAEELATDERLRADALRDDLAPLDMLLFMTILFTGPVTAWWLALPVAALGVHMLAAVVSDRRGVWARVA